jgi:hypothetical protein
MISSFQAFMVGCFLLLEGQVSAGVSLLTQAEYDERQIPPNLAKILCERQATADDFFKHELYDAQVQLVRLFPKVNSVLTRTQVLERALRLAADHNQGGFAYGLCADGSAWSLTMPSREPISLVGDHLRLTPGMVRQCASQSIQLNFARESHGRSVRLAVSDNVSAALPKVKGYVSLSCVLEKQRNAGVRELALIPLEGATRDVLSLGKTLIGGMPKNLLAWINAQRSSEGLPPLVENTELSNAATVLMGKQSMSHDMKRLSQVKAALTRKGIGLYGENRVTGKNIEELAALLWMSPIHRDLILNPSADVIGIRHDRKQSADFAVMIVGRKRSGSLAERPK